MESNENNDNLEGQVVANAEIAGAENQGQNQENNESTLPTWQEQVIAHAKSQGREIETVDDLLKPIEVEKEVIKEINPWADVIDADEEVYLKFKRETKLGRKEFDALNVDVDAIDPIEIAREQARRDIGVSNLSSDMADQHIADKLGIDLDELSEYDKVKLLGYGKAIRDEKKSQQEQYRKPVENKIEPKQESDKQEYIELPNGAVMRKSDYEAAQTAQQKTTEEALKAVKTVIKANFKMSVDDNGTVTEVDIPYEYHEKDSQKMESIISDLQGTIDKRYRTGEEFNHAGFAEDMLWSDKEFREKTVSDLAAKVRAKAIEETLKLVGNHNFDPAKPLDKQTREGVKFVPFDQLGR